MRHGKNYVSTISYYYYEALTGEYEIKTMKTKQIV